MGSGIFNFFYGIYPNIDQNISRLFTLLITIVFFFLSTFSNYKKIFFNIFVFIKNLFKRRDKEIKEDFNNDSLGNEVGIKETKQQSFSFKETNSKKTNEYNLPSISLLEKKQSQILKNSIVKNPEPDFIEKVLLDFGISGKIKKVNNGPVVTLYEFEPAPGIKVSK